MKKDLTDLIGKEDLQDTVEIPVGTKFLVRIGGVKKQLSSHLLGYEQGSFLVIRSPNLSEVVGKLFVGNRITLHYLNCGTLMGFQSTILDSVTKPFPLTFVNYPSFVARRDLRQRPRANCCLLANIEVKDDKFQGLIVNISTSGCRFVLSRDQALKLPTEEKGKKMSLSFFLSDETGYLQAETVIRNRYVVENLQVLGLQFSQLDKKTHAVVDRYVTTILVHSVPELQSAEI